MKRLWIRVIVESLMVEGFHSLDDLSWSPCNFRGVSRPFLRNIE